MNKAGHVLLLSSFRGRRPTQKFPEFQLCMTTLGGQEFEFVFRGRRVLKFLSEAWALPGAELPGFRSLLNNTIKQRFPEGARFDLICWARYKELEGVAWMGRPVIHVVLFRPAGEKRWPVPLPEPASESGLIRSFSEQYADAEVIAAYKPPALPNEPLIRCGMNAVLQCVASCREIAMAFTCPGSHAEKGELLSATGKLIAFIGAGHTPATLDLQAAFAMMKRRVGAMDDPISGEDARSIWNLLVTIAAPPACALSKKSVFPCPKCQKTIQRQLITQFTIILAAGDVTDLALIAQKALTEEVSLATAECPCKPTGASATARNDWAIQGGYAILVLDLPSTDAKIEIKDFVLGKTPMYVVATVEARPGHWVAWIKNGSAWWCCNDARVSSQDTIPPAAHSVVFAKARAFDLHSPAAQPSGSATATPATPGRGKQTKAKP